jgi:hypothetical protein
LPFLLPIPHDERRIIWNSWNLIRAMPLRHLQSVDQALAGDVVGQPPEVIAKMKAVLEK